MLDGYRSVCTLGIEASSRQGRSALSSYPLSYHSPLSLLSLRPLQLLIMDFEALRNYLSTSTADDEFKLASPATEEICSFLDQYREKLDDNNVFDAFCLLVQIAVYCRNNTESARNEVEALYASYAINSETAILEFYQLGEAIAVVTQLCSDRGAECLRGCQLTLPFCRNSPEGFDTSEKNVDKSNDGKYDKITDRSKDIRSANCDGNSNSNSNKNESKAYNKVIVNISTPPHLFAIQRFWCNVLTTITSLKFNVPIDFNVPKGFLTVLTMFSHLNQLDTISSTVKSVCLTVITVLRDEKEGLQSSSLQVPSQITVGLDVLRWLAGSMIFRYTVIFSAFLYSILLFYYCLHYCTLVF